MALYPIFIRKIVLPLGDRVWGTSNSKFLKFLEKSQWWDGRRMEQYQNKKLRVLIEHAYRNVPYYHKIFRERNLFPGDIQTSDDLVKLPFLTKDIIRKNFPHDIVAKNIPKNQMLLSGSSGSTGEPLQYYITKDAYQFNTVCYSRGWQWMGYRLGDGYIKLSQNPRSSTYKKLQDILFRCDFMFSQGLTQKDVTTLVNKFRKKRFTIIRGYPSTLSVLSNFISENSIVINKPHAINTTGEILFPEMRELIESTFACPVFDSYSGEGGALMFECENHTYHISSEYAITEFVDNDGNTISEGRGEIVSTNLWNYALPFIRYKVKDFAVLNKTVCSCGRGLLSVEKIEGRDVDMLSTPAGKILIVHFFTGYFEWINTVDQFQVVQDAEDSIILKMVTNSKFSDNDLSMIRNDMKDYIGADMNLKMQIVDEIPLARSGKRRFVIRECN